MLNQNKLYLGRHICLPVSLCPYENDYLYEEKTCLFSFGYKARC